MTGTTNHSPRRPGPTRLAPRRSPLVWLLVVPLLAVIYPPLYNHVDPALLGIPFFYWYQLAVIPVSVVCTAVVYRATQPRSGDPMTQPRSGDPMTQPRSGDPMTQPRSGDSSAPGADEAPGTGAR